METYKSGRREISSDNQSLSNLPSTSRVSSPVFRVDSQHPSQFRSSSFAPSNTDRQDLKVSSQIRRSQDACGTNKPEASRGYSGSRRWSLLSSHAQRSVNTATNNQVVDLHARMGHAPFDVIRKMFNNGLIKYSRVPAKSNGSSMWRGCQQRKMV